MIISGKEIHKRLGTDIIIRPFDEKRINPNSYNLSLNDEVMIYNASILDMKKEMSTKTIKIPEEGFMLYPGELYLARTVEYTETKGLVPMIEGRSSIARLGICIHVTAGFGDVGFKGWWTLEISVVKPVRIYPFIEIAQIYYHEIAGEYDEYCSGKYQNNKDVQPSLLWTELNK